MSTYLLTLGRDFVRKVRYRNNSRPRVGRPPSWLYFTELSRKRKERGKEKREKEEKRKGGREREKRGEKEENVILITTNHFALGIQERSLHPRYRS